MLPINLALVSQSRQSESRGPGARAPPHCRSRRRAISLRCGPCRPRSSRSPRCATSRPATGAVVIVDDVQGAAGYHQDDHGAPVRRSSSTARSWSLTASHEVLEMLVDPFGKRTAAGRSPKSGQGQVEFLGRGVRPVRGVAVRVHDRRRARVGLHHAALLRPAPDHRRALLVHRRDRSGRARSATGGYMLVVGPAAPTTSGRSCGSARRQPQFRRPRRRGTSARVSRCASSSTPAPSTRGSTTGLPEDDEALADAREGWQGATASAEALARAARGGGQSSPRRLT